MKTSHKYSLATLATAVVIFNFTSCKYEDGPKISLKSKTARLVGEWEVKEIDGESLGKDFEFLMEFQKDGDFEFTYSYYGYDYTSKGEWDWEDKKETIDINLDGDHIEFKVNRLTSSELWWEDEDRDEWILEK